MDSAILVLGLGSILGLVALDVLRPARAFPRVRWWRLRGVLGFALYLALAGALPLLWDGWLGEHRLLDASGLDPWVGGVIGVLVLQLFSYAWHRTMHSVPLLWRLFHQMHHSAERLDVFGAFLFHPLDVLGFTFVGSFALVFVFGVSAEAAMVANVIGLVCAVFQHANIRTPRWLGLFVQRPESHAVHHQRGLHSYNYSDFPLWDIVFGTYFNPAHWRGEVGFYDGASSRVAEMLIGRDVSTPRSGR